MAYTDLLTLKDALSITHSEDDTLLQQALDAAASAIDKRTGRTFERDNATSAREYRTRSRTSLDHDGEALTVDDIADETGIIVEVGNGTEWEQLNSDEYDLEPDNAIVRGFPITRIRRINSRWTLNRKARITADWGWPAVPDDIVEANILQASRLYRRPDSPEGVAGSAEWGLIRIPHLDPDVRALVDPFRLSGF